MKKNNITLIGMPGAGKSTVGVLLAKTLGYNFIDTDLVMQRKYGDVLHVLLQRYGSDRFKEMEQETLLEVDASHTVIATGGSAIYSDAAMRHLQQISDIVYLDVPFTELENRIQNITTRGIVLGEGETLYGLYLHRLPLYHKYADHVIAFAKASPESVISRIVEQLKIGL